MNKEEILDRMQSEMPYQLNKHTLPYIKEAMKIFSDQQTATLQQELDRLKTPWVPISEYDGKSVVLRWHILWKSPIAVYPKINDSIVVWYEKTLTTMWPDAAFGPFYMPLPEPPQP